MAKTKYDPTWKQYEKDIKSDNVDTAMKATEAFTAERDKELKTSAKAREFEKARRKEAARNKPQWVKERTKTDQAPIKSFLKGLMTGGTFSTDVKPLPGFALILVDEPKEQSEGGIILPGSEEIPNTGTVLGIGKELHISHDKTNVPPTTTGKRVMFKKGAGMEMTVKGEYCLLMQFSDLLMEVEDG